MTNHVIPPLGDDPSPPPSEHTPPPPWPGYDPLTWHFPEPARSGDPAHGAPGPWTPPPAAGPAPAKRREGGIIGALAAIGLGVIKYGFILLKFFKFGAVFSILLTYLLWASFYGWQFGAGVIVLVFVHEMGHVVFARAQGLSARAPIFFGIGAATRIGGISDERQSALVSIGGPVVGTAGALVCFVIARSLAAGEAQGFMLALASFGCFINLLNLIPMVPFDGGKVAAALSPWLNLVGLAIVGAMFFITHNDFLLIFAIIGGFTTWHRFQAARRGGDLPQATGATRAGIAVAYAVMLCVTAGGMILAQNALISGGYRVH